MAKKIIFALFLKILCFKILQTLEIEQSILLTGFFTRWKDFFFVNLNEKL